MDWTDTENLQPLKSGRSFKANTGMDVEATPKAVLQAADKKRAEMLQQTKSCSGGDLLRLWVRLIKFVNEAYKSGSKSQLVLLLEQCTRELMITRDYEAEVKDDSNYLRLWIQYADNLPDPTDVFTLLEDKGIGHKHALLYEAHASFLESNLKAHAKARAAFELGISRFAAPLNRLQNNFDAFNARMARREERRAQGGVSAAPVDPGPVDENGAPVVRRTFAELSSHRTADGQRPGQSFLPTHGLAGIKRSAPSSGAAGNDSVEVFVDEEFGGEASGEVYQAPRSLMDSVPSLEAGSKENRELAVPLSRGSFRFPQRRGAAPQPAPELDIPIDDDLIDEQPCIQPPTSQVSVRRRLDAAPSSQAALEDAPLRLHNAPSTSAASTHVAAAAPASAAPPASKPAPSMICEHMLVDSQGREVCFEELRAEHMRRQAPSPAAAEPDSLAMGQEVVNANAMPGAAAAAPATISDSNEQATTPNSAQVNAAGCPEDPAAPTPTPQQQLVPIATKTSPVQEAGRGCNAENGVPDENAVPLTATDAEAPLGGGESQSSVGQTGAPRTALGVRSFAGPVASEPLQQQRGVLGLLGGGDVSSSMPYSPGTGGGSDDTTSFDIFGGAFSGALPEALPAGLEPTVTINTLEAYSEMNDMFQSTLPHVAPNPGPRTSIPLPPRPPGGRRNSGAFASRISRHSSVLPAYATQPLPALHELEQARHDGNLTACFGAASRGLQHDDDTASAQMENSHQPDDDRAGLVYEDTEFLPTLGANGSIDEAEDEDCLLVREDTQFLPDGERRATPDELPAAQPAAVFASQSPSPRAATRRVSRALFSPAPAPLGLSPVPSEIPCEDQENNPPPGAALRVVQSGPVPVLRALQPCCESRGIKVGRGYASDEDEVEGGKLIPSETILAQAGSELQDEFEVYCDVN